MQGEKEERQVRQGAGKSNTVEEAGEETKERKENRDECEKEHETGEGKSKKEITRKQDGTGGGI